MTTTAKTKKNHLGADACAENRLQKSYHLYDFRCFNCVTLTALFLHVVLNSYTTPGKLSTVTLTASWPSSFESDHPDENSCTLPPLSPLQAAATAICCADSEVSDVCD